jgi:hypothetical protein
MGLSRPWKISSRVNHDPAFFYESVWASHQLHLRTLLI